MFHERTFATTRKEIHHQTKRSEKISVEVMSGYKKANMVEREMMGGSTDG